MLYDGIIQLEISSLKMLSLGRENIKISSRVEFHVYCWYAFAT